MDDKIKILELIGQLAFIQGYANSAAESSNGMTETFFRDSMRTIAKRAAETLEKIK